MAKRRTAKKYKKTDDLPAEWQCIRTTIPGYDPHATCPDNCYFDADAAETVCDKFFYGALTLVEGDTAGKPFKLQDWQRAIAGSLFGYKREDRSRRYREAMIGVPRKNGKTPFAAGIALWMLVGDGEHGPQVYSAAADQPQAALVFRHAKGFIEENPKLGSQLKVYHSFKSIETRAGLGIYKALSADAWTKHGLNVSCAVVDELHAHPNRELTDVLRSATGTRRQPLIIYITTSDYDRESICNEKWDYARKVRDGIIEVDNFLPALWEATTDDDWTDPAVWARVNPNLGVSVLPDFLASECQLAKETPTYENTFKRLYLNLRTEQDVRWLSLEAWDRCGGPVGDLDGQQCFAGLDLAATIDVAALVLYFPQQSALLPFFWVPSESADKRERKDRVPYVTWGRQGLINLTPGNVIDYDRIRVDINELGRRYNIRAIGIDRWNSTQLQTQLAGDGFNVVQFGQGYKDMTAPTKELEKRIISSSIRHGGNSVLRWMASNVMIESDDAGNIKPSKKKSSEKIDGIVAAIMAIGMALLAGPEVRGVPKCIII